MCWYQQRALNPENSAATTARRTVAQAIGQRVGSAQWVELVQFDASLIASELVTNAVQAGASRLILIVRVHRSRVRVTVSDDATGLPQITSARRSDVSGRGLALVDTVSLEWGVDGGAIGKDVWADLALAPDAFPHGPLRWCYEVDEDDPGRPANGHMGASAAWVRSTDR
jgi:anti-sigma regulatory factor (Ser/Thr protein kinase)